MNVDILEYTLYYDNNMPRKSRIDDPQLRRRMLGRAAELFAKQGFSETPTSELGCRGEFSEGRYFTYFGNKEGVLRGIFDDYWRQMRDNVCNLEKQVGDPEERVRRITHAAVEVFTHNEDLFRVVTKYPCPRQVDNTAPGCPYMHEFQDVAVRAIHEATEGMGDPERRKWARMIYHSIRGTLEHLLNAHYHDKRRGNVTFTTADIQDYMDRLVRAAFDETGRLGARRRDGGV